MLMSMMNVGKMWVRVRHWFMNMLMRMRFIQIHVRRVFVLMMGVVNMAM